MDQINDFFIMCSLELLPEAHDGQHAAETGRDCKVIF